MNEHHALLLYNDEPLTFDVSEVLGRTPDRLYQIQKCTVADVRTIISSAWLRPADIGRTEQLILIATEFIVEEAQQALLKIIEEPPVGTRFVFVLPTGYIILPTLQSRFQIISELVEHNETEVFENFLRSDYKGRFEAIETAIKNKDTAWQKGIKDGLRSYLTTQKATLTQVPLEQLQYVLQTLLTRGASNKFLLEQLALVLPTRSN
jgi:DNA polymerase III delta prime subunit